MEDGKILAGWAFIDKNDDVFSFINLKNQWSNDPKIRDNDQDEEYILRLNRDYSGLAPFKIIPLYR